MTADRPIDVSINHRRNPPRLARPRRSASATNRAAIIHALRASMAARVRAASIIVRPTPSSPLERDSASLIATAGLAGSAPVRRCCFGRGVGVRVGRSTTTATCGRSCRRTASPAMGSMRRSREAELRLDVAESATADRGGSRGDRRRRLGGERSLAANYQRRRVGGDAASRLAPGADGRAEGDPAGGGSTKGPSTRKHWAFIPPVKAMLPDVCRQAWVKNEIDRFVSGEARSAKG